MRLTQTHDFFKYILPEYNCMGENQASEVQLEETDYTCKKYVIGEAIRQFGLIEDVLEKHKVESAEELDLILQELKDVHQENANLKNELAELKQKAIVPKEDRFVIVSNEWKHNKKRGIAKVQQIMTDHYTLQTNDYLGSYVPCIQYGEFRTLEEAKQKLAEMGGKNE